MFVGLPSWWNAVLFYAVILLIPVSLFWPVFVAQWRRLKGSVDPQGPPDLKIWHRCLCVLLAYVFFVTPEGFLHLSQAAIQYGQLSTASWGQGDTTIVYEYDNNGSTTKKTTKTTSTQTIREVVDYSYNLQGKLKEVRTNKQAGTVEVAQYAYTPSGDRYRSTTWTEVSGTPGNYQTKLFVVDTQNPTGYSQVLEEWTYNTQNPVYGTTAPTSVKYYTIGDDIISQAIGSDTSAGMAQYLLYDGHGSTRQLLNHTYNVDGAGKPITADSYSYDGYGVMLGDTANAENNAQTNMLYCGEQYDKNLSQYYLRARYYNPLNGLFNQVDQFPGNISDPQSLHKYLYVHANPVNSIDPTGESASYAETLTVTDIMGVLMARIAPLIIPAIKMGIKLLLTVSISYMLSRILPQIYDMITEGIAGATALLTAMTSSSITMAMEYEKALFDAAEALDRSIEELRMLPVFFVFEAATPNIYAFNVFWLTMHPQWHVLTYAADPIQAIKNRIGIMGLYGHLKGEGQSIDEFPYACTEEGGPPDAVGYPVPWRENCVQGGYLGYFVLSELKCLPQEFLVVPVPAY
jgi:RHS repeat-associated protein